MAASDRRIGSAVVAALAIACAIVAVVAAGHVVRTFADSSHNAQALDLAAGLSLLGAGALAWFVMDARRLGVVAMLAAAAWFAPDWEAWTDGGALVHSVGSAVAPLFIVLVADLASTVPRRPPRRAVPIAYAVVGALVVCRALVWDPFLDPACWRNCLDNVFLIGAEPAVARTLDDVLLVVVAAIGAAACAVAILRLRSMTPVGRRELGPVLAFAALVGATEAAHAVALLRTPLEDPGSAGFAVIFAVRAVCVAGLGLGLTWMVVRGRLVRSAVARLAADLAAAPAPGGLRDALAATVRDPSLEVAYWLAGSRRYVDADGEPIHDPEPGPRRARTPIVRSGRTLAMVVHDSALLDSLTFERDIGSAARLVVENERLQAEVRAQLGDLRASRARIVETADAERRRLERDLHDGAQQRLLALSYDLRVACAAAETDRDPVLRAQLTAAVDEARSALADLRELAHGIYPAILSESGLAAALATLADDASVAVELEAVTRERYTPAVESAAYAAIAEAVSDAAARSATFASVVVRANGRGLVIEVRDDGAARRAELLRVADRIGALGGSVATHPGALTAEIPCA
jgi:signal transduction histidine kinase